MSDIIVEHGTTSDGLMAARVDGLAYIAIPLKEGFSIVSGCYNFCWRSMFLNKSLQNVI